MTQVEGSTWRPRETAGPARSDFGGLVHTSASTVESRPVAGRTISVTRSKSGDGRGGPSSCIIYSHPLLPHNSQEKNFSVSSPTDGTEPRLRVGRKRNGFTAAMTPRYSRAAVLESRVRGTTAVPPRWPGRDPILPSSQTPRPPWAQAPRLRAPPPTNRTLVGDPSDLLPTTLRPREDRRSDLAWINPRYG